MRRRFLLCRWCAIGFAMVALLLSPVAAQAAGVLRVMSFNVRTASAVDGPDAWPMRRDLMVRTIRQVDPDVLGTQELLKEQGDYLAARLPGYAWFGEGRRGGDGDEHMGVFYRTARLRVVASGNFWLSDTPDVPGSISWGNLYPRMVTWALFEDRANHRRFYYYNTHFPYRGQDGAARTRCAQEILARIRTLPQQALVILAGDFNSPPDRPGHALLTAVLHDARLDAHARSGPDKTFHAFTGVPDQRIDWILYRDFDALAQRTVTTHDGIRYPSDHFAVMAVLRWPPADAGNAPPVD